MWSAHLTPSALTAEIFTGNRIKYEKSTDHRITQSDLNATLTISLIPTKNYAHAKNYIYIDINSLI